MEKATKRLLAVANVLLMLLGAWQVGVTQAEEIVSCPDCGEPTHESLSSIEGQEGERSTGLQVTVTAQVIWEAAYDWSITQSIEPDWLELTQGQSAELTYIIDAIRSEAGETHIVQGTIYAQNDDENDAHVLLVEDAIEYKLHGSGGWVELQRVTVISEEWIPAGERGEWAYSLPFVPVMGAVSYRNVAYVTLVNHRLRERTLCERTGFALPDTLTSVKDACAMATDLPTIPEGFLLVGDSIPGDGRICNSTSFNIRKTVTNDSAVPGSCAEPNYYLENTATIIEEDTGRSSEDSTAIAITVRQPGSARQWTCTFEGPNAPTVYLNYLLFLPKRYGADSEKKWPLILFLHGAGERGDDLERIKRHGIPKIVEQQEDFEFIAVSPQCPADSTWVAEIGALNALLDEIVATHTVDTTRIYLTGLSMGGYGTWHLATAYPERFAAIAPICGGGLPEMGFPERVCALKDTPVWNFHGAKDPVVPIEESEVLVNTLQECGGDVRFTIYPDAQHDAWTQTYVNPELYEWFLRHLK